MRKKTERRLLPVDPDHMHMLHQEAAEQLELMQTALEAAAEASGTPRDSLEEIAQNHWHSYLDVLHMICLHDETLSAVLQKKGLTARDPETDEPGSSFPSHRSLLLLITIALTRRHRRFCHIYSLRGNPMNEYVKDSLAIEREHVAALAAIIENLL